MNENAVEQFAIELLVQQGWQHLYGPDIGPDSGSPLRSNWQEVLLPERLSAVSILPCLKPPARMPSSRWSGATRRS